MAQKGWKPSLRYSPVNGIIVDWGIGAETFSMCGMPKPACPAPSPVKPAEPVCCGEEPMIEPVATSSWSRWTPEIEVGLQDASTDMAASYARRAAIQFAKESRVLQRQIALCLTEGTTRYPVEAFDQERVQGIITVASREGQHCMCCGSGGHPIGEVRFDIARQELIFSPRNWRTTPRKLLITVWAAPTEDACEHDEFLYEQYRSEITEGARGMMIAEAHAYGQYQTSRGYANFRGDAMLLQQAEALKMNMRKAARRIRVDAEQQLARGDVAHQWRKGGLFR